MIFCIALLLKPVWRKINEYIFSLYRLSDKKLKNKHFKLLELGHL